MDFSVLPNGRRRATKRPGERLLRAHERRLLFPGAGARRRERGRRPARRSARQARPGFIPAAASITPSPRTAAATPISTPRSSTARSLSTARPATAATASAWRGSTSTTDPTLRPGDIVATESGLVAFTGMKNTVADFTPIDNDRAVPKSTREKLAGVKIMPTAAPRTAPVSMARRAARATKTAALSFRDSRPLPPPATANSVSPGDSIPNICTNPGRPCCAGASIRKSACRLAAAR